jgi:hypothetical protein
LPSGIIASIQSRRERRPRRTPLTFSRGSYYFNEPSKKSDSKM